ncbi:fasciclin domain-containing protein [Pedobacter sp. MC2016-24]|uniref:fasciclin domain-containing protein n=1 Tax=Pedobacter sp. MC2016-24 TaxID=2780090 RepID=UPI001882222F|nr:fasciclin domain-containing protein [Pedobacter sp. MC2016-24]MBE9600880.1 fasciclin domain-containing protein [Pedobacter sp. MC2016-24]
MRYLKNIITVLLLSGFTTCLFSCKKEAAQVESINGTISAVIADNFNLAVFSTGLKQSGLNSLMLEKGPFTVIAPSDAAFSLAGFPNAVSILSAPATRISSIMNYHVLRGTYELNKLPFLFNQEIRSSNGGKLFATRWIKGQDTILTLNGSRVLSQNIKATNGLIQVTNRVLEPYVHERISESLASDRNLSLFYQALRRSGILATLDGKATFTVFAPVNSAMESYGLGNVEDINKMDPEVLSKLVSYHILANRRFIYDYVLTAGATPAAEQAMMDGNSVKITLVSDPQIPGDFKGITLLGTGNTSVVNLIKQDVLSGNGVVHSIDAVLKITQ